MGEPFSLMYLDHTDSTNSALLAALRQGHAHAGQAYATGDQRAGRGRADNSWICPPGGGLALSVAIDPVPVPPAHTASVVHAVGLAVLDAIHTFTPDGELALGWPNDVLVRLPGSPALPGWGQWRKLAGILCERAEDGTIVAGIGVNVDLSTDRLPVTWATSLSFHTSATPTWQEVATAILQALPARLDAWRAGSGNLEDAGLIPDLLAHAAWLGHSVRARRADTVVTGEFRGIDEQGAAIIETEEGMVTWLSGEIRQVRFRDRKCSGACDTAARHIARLIGGTPTMTVPELAQAAGVSDQFVRTFWRAMGFPDAADDAVIFTAHDVRAVQSWLHLLRSGRVDQRTAVTLLRAESHMTDRLVLWQIEALIDDAARRYNLDDTSARLVVLDSISDLDELLTEQLGYAWRRQLAALTARIEAEVGQRPVGGSSDELPLVRALGFVDMVSYTRRSLGLGVSQLTELVQGFEFISRDVITTMGGRIVKTIGDAVLYIADDIATGARIVTHLLQALAADPRLPPVRASLVQGRVVSHSGDIYGPVVNLASRLSDLAAPGTVLMDDESAQLLRNSDVADSYRLLAQPPVDVQGVGEVHPVELIYLESPAP